MSTLRRARKHHLSNLRNELSNLSPSSKTLWPLVKFVSGVCSPSIPSLTSNGTTADSAHEKAECLNSVFASQSCIPNLSLSCSRSLYPPFPVVPNCSQTLYFALEKPDKFLAMLNSDSATGPDGISSCVRKTCSFFFWYTLSKLV